MTKQEILSLENLKVAEEIEGKFVHIHAQDGYRLTCYKEGDDIKQYYGSICIYFPIKEEYPDYYTITVAEHEKMVDMREKAIELEMEERTKKD
jgi:hypothetical protein